ncbi:hypothetical protein C8Q78DRAFT_349717 [Trametes maxima]|nr:hypothetical protein C8Q78DRAFT_349717 [Trametes maxima]
MSVKRPLSNGQAYFAPQANPERPTTPVNPISASLPFALERVDNATTVDPTVRLEKTLTAMLSICNDTGFQGLLREYCEEVTDERERYAPFVAIFNEALRRLGTIKVSECKYRKRDALDIHFCRNAEKEIEGIHFSGVDVNQTVSTKRKPDIVLSALATLMRIYEVEEGYDNFLAAAMEQPPQNLSWHEVLGSWEFKLDKTKLDYPEEMHYGTTLQTEYGPMKLDQHSATHEIRKVGDRSPPAKRKKKEFIQPIAGKNSALLY